MVSTADRPRLQPGSRRRRGVDWLRVNERVARLWFALTSLVVTTGLVVQLVLAARNETGRFESVPARIVNVLSFFTIQSNILVAVTSGLLAWRLHRPGGWFRTARLSGLVAITITGVVFHLALADLQELDGTEAAVDWILHTASPVLCVLGWVFFGPRRQTDRSIAVRSVAFPVAWLAYTLVRGAVVEDRSGRDYYPYPFLDVVDHGYARVAVNIGLVAVLFAVLAIGAVLLDRRLLGRRAAG